jgi:hypothetical protein
MNEKLSDRTSETENFGEKKQGRFMQFVIKVLISLPLVLFAYWLITLVYFPAPEVQEARKKQAEAREAEEGIFRKIIKGHQAAEQVRFHVTEDGVAQSEPFQPLCITCHGTLPHSKEEKIRSMLNFHTNFMSCTVCHVRKDPQERDFFYEWVDRQTGRMTMSVEGAFGQYPAKIFPVKISSTGQPEIYHPVSEKAAEEFLELKDQFTPDQMAQAKIKLHERLTQKPVLCQDCHKKDGYFDFKKLGFPQNRIDSLTSNEVVGMIQKYETFYMPEAIDFGSRPSR